MGVLETAAVALAFFLLGRYLAARRREPKPVEAVCGCTHHHAMHAPGTGACNATVRVNHYGGTYTREACPCVRYSGPEPVGGYFAPEIAGE